MKYLNVQNCRKLANANGKQLSKDALYKLNLAVFELIEQAAQYPNGNAKRIDGFLMQRLITNYKPTK